MDYAVSLGAPKRYQNAAHAINSRDFDADCQVLEVEADSDALDILCRYRDLNELEENQFEAMVEGVAMTLTIFEFMDLISTAVCNSPELAINTYYTDKFARNFVIPAEHPCAPTRLELALGANDRIAEKDRQLIERVDREQRVVQSVNTI